MSAQRRALSYNVAVSYTSGGALAAPPPPLQPSAAALRGSVTRRRRKSRADTGATGTTRRCQRSANAASHGGLHWSFANAPPPSFPQRPLIETPAPRAAVRTERLLAIAMARPFESSRFIRRLPLPSPPLLSPCVHLALMSAQCARINLRLKSFQTILQVSRYPPLPLPFP